MRAIAVLALVWMTGQDPGADIARQKRIAEVLPPLKRVKIDATERKLKEVLQDLQRQSGIPMEFADLADIPVTLQAKEEAPLEAATAVCRAAGLGFAIGVGNGAKSAAIWFNRDGFADAPRFFSSHFMVEVANLTLTRRTGADPSGTVTLKLTWPPNVIPDTALLDVSTMTDEKGRVLYERPEKASYGASDYGGMPGRIQYTTSARIEFRHPVEGAEKIGIIRGSALILFAGEDRYLTFEASETAFGKKRQMAGVSAELRDIRVEGDVTTVTFAHQGWPVPAMPGMRSAPRGLGSRYWQVRLQDGTIAVSTNSGTRHDGPMRVEELKFFGLTSKIATVEVLAETVFHRETFDFEFKNVPLPK